MFIIPIIICLFSKADIQMSRAILSGNWRGIKPSSNQPLFICIQPADNISISIIDFRVPHSFGKSTRPTPNMVISR